MEVHHHSHSSRKKWNHYLWEFLMLFLAVFCGFTAENLREHSIEHKREKQFAKQLLADLRADSTFFAKRTVAINDILPGYDSLKMFLMQSPAASDKDIVKLNARLFWVYDLNLTNTTFSQMKTSGTLRYIRNGQLVASLQKYYEVLAVRLQTVTADQFQHYNQYYGPFFIKHFRVQDADQQTGELLTDHPAMLDRTPQSDQEFLNISGVFQSLLSSQVKYFIAPAQKQVGLLMGMIREQYHLK